MKKYISILRGINVNGKNVIKMDELRKLFELLGFTDVRTYIQSGNVLFNSISSNKIKMISQIKASINRKFGYDVKGLIKTKDEIEKVINQNPFLKLDNVDIKKLYVTFLERIPEKEFIDSLIPNKNTNDVYKIIGTEIYLYCPGGYGKTIFSNTYIEKKLGLKATTRNWETVNKLLQLASE